MTVAKATIELCVLWEDEIRAAAAAIRKMGEASDEDWPIAAREALRACAVALNGADEKNAIVMIGAAEVRKRAKGVI